MRRTGAGAAALCWASLALAGCSATDRLLPSEGGGSTLANLLAFNTTKPGPVPAAGKVEEPLRCPAVQVLDGTAAYRTYAGADQTNANVRYQFAMGDVARECTRSGNDILLKVGVEGRVLLGPAGSPGSFTVPVRVAIRRDSDQKAVAAKLYQVPATIAAGEDATGFQVVTEPLAVPFVQSHADDDYTILVGFDAAKPAAPAPAGRARKGRPAAPAGAAPPG